MKKFTYLLGTTMIIAAVVAGCGGGSSSVREVKMITRGMTYEPAVIQAKAGEKIKFTVENVDKEDHEFESEELKFDELEIPPGKTRAVEVTMPDKAGEYEFFCDAPGHKEKGMVGKIVVSQQ